MDTKLTFERLQRKALVYVRQSSMLQVIHNLESQRRQYGLTGRAQELGFRDIEVIDEDLGRSGSGCVNRPGFERLVTQVCSGEVGGVICVEASRLARNGRDWLRPPAAGHRLRGRYRAGVRRRSVRYGRFLSWRSIGNRLVADWTGSGVAGPALARGRSDFPACRCPHSRQCSGG